LLFTRKSETHSFTFADCSFFNQTSGDFQKAESKQNNSLRSAIVN